jgi:hypothetical protein
LICQEEMEPVRLVAGLEQEEEWAVVEEEDAWEEIVPDPDLAASAYVLHAARSYLTNRVSPATILSVPSVGIQWSRGKKRYYPGIESHLEDSTNIYIVEGDVRGDIYKH